MQQWADLKGWLSQQTISTGLQPVAGHSSELLRGQALSVMQEALQSFMSQLRIAYSRAVLHDQDLLIISPSSSQLELDVNCVYCATSDLSTVSLAMSQSPMFTTTKPATL